MTVLPLAASVTFVCSNLEQIPQKTHLYLLCPVPLLQSCLTPTPQSGLCPSEFHRNYSGPSHHDLPKSSGQFSVLILLIASDIMDHILLLHICFSLGFQSISLSWFLSSLHSPSWSLPWLPLFSLTSKCWLAQDSDFNPLLFFIHLFWWSHPDMWF